jgi:type II secretory ATPase GspE/PulE/Tfp pilus assembly ATPase PilB-like protein
MEALYLVCGRRRPQLKRNPLGGGANLDPMTSPERRSAANPLAHVFDLSAHEDAPIAAFRNAILREALKTGYVHVQVVRESDDRSAILFEREGTWEREIEPPGVMHNALVNRLKVMGNLHIDRKPEQQGRIYALYQGREVVIAIEVKRLLDGTEAVDLALPIPGASAT